MSAKEKTLIGVLASHDSREKNEALHSVLEAVTENQKLHSVLARFRFVFTGGTYDRLFKGEPVQHTGQNSQFPLSDKAKEFLKSECGVIRLPRTEEGGITMLASLIPQRKISILWPFLTPLTTHLYTPENQALLRLGDQWRVKRLMNTGSVKEWIKTEADRDYRLNVQSMPLRLELPGSEFERSTFEKRGAHHLEIPPTDFPDLKTCTRTGDWSGVTIALISHDEMKGRMMDFVTDYERELAGFKRILATGTTGRLVEEAAPVLAKRDDPKVYRYHSGPKGGDIEIATEVLFHRCHVVIFFVDPLHPHPHLDDIRVIFGACMIHDDVRMLTNENQARDWMDRVVRGT